MAAWNAFVQGQAQAPAAAAAIPNRNESTYRILSDAGHNQFYAPGIIVNFARMFPYLITKLREHDFSIDKVLSLNEQSAAAQLRLGIAANKVVDIYTGAHVTLNNFFE